MQLEDLALIGVLSVVLVVILALYMRKVKKFGPLPFSKEAAVIASLLTAIMISLPYLLPPSLPEVVRGIICGLVAVVVFLASALYMSMKKKRESKK